MVRSGRTGSRFDAGCLRTIGWRSPASLLRIMLLLALIDRTILSGNSMALSDSCLKLPARMNGDDPAGKPRERGPLEPRPGDLAAKTLGVGKPGDRFDEITIGLTVARDQAADKRDDAKRIGFIETVEGGHVHIRKLETEELAATPKNPVRLGQRLVDARHVANSEADRIGIEAVIGEGQLLGVCLDEVERRCKIALGGAGAPSSLLQHGGVDV